MGRRVPIGSEEQWTLKSTSLSLVSHSFLSIPKAGGSVSDVLLEGLLPVVDYEQCSQWDWWGSTVNKCHICAGGYEVSGCNVSWLTFVVVGQYPGPCSMSINV